MFDPQYQWLLKEQSPRLLVNALHYYGTKEIPGADSNTVIMDWAKKLGKSVSSWYNNDDIPWCGLFIAYICQDSFLPIVKEPLRALSWAEWGVQALEPSLGDILVFKRPGGGHVGIYVGEDEHAYHVLGGNQGNAVSIIRIEKSRLYACRRTKWSIAKPANVKPVYLKSNGAISENEA